MTEKPECWDEVNEAANDMTLVCDRLENAGLQTLSAAARDLMDRIEAVLEGDSPQTGDTD